MYGHVMARFLRASVYVSHWNVASVYYFRCLSVDVYSCTLAALLRFAATATFKNFVRSFSVKSQCDPKILLSICKFTMSSCKSWTKSMATSLVVNYPITFCLNRLNPCNCMLREIILSNFRIFFAYSIAKPARVVWTVLDSSVLLILANVIVTCSAFCKLILRIPSVEQSELRSNVNQIW
jgi:hypothetical protein